MDKTHTRTAMTLDMDPSAFEQTQLPKLLKKAERFARRAEVFGKRFDAEETACAALPILYSRYAKSIALFEKRHPGKPLAIHRNRHEWRCARAVSISATGGDIGTGSPLPADLAGRKTGYRSLKPWNAASYADEYNLPPAGRRPDGISQADLQAMHSPLAEAISRPRRSRRPPVAHCIEWIWITARDSGASHIEAAKACGKNGSDKACESFSLRIAKGLQIRALENGFGANYDNGLGRSCARTVKTENAAGNESWLADVIAGKTNPTRGI